MYIVNGVYVYIVCTAVVVVFNLLHIIVRRKTHSAKAERKGKLRSRRWAFNVVNLPTQFWYATYEDNQENSCAERARGQAVMFAVMFRYSECTRSTDIRCAQFRLSFERLHHKLISISLTQHLCKCDVRVIFGIYVIFGHCPWWLCTLTY
jgi:hypothetical protein